MKREEELCIGLLIIITFIVSIANYINIINFRAIQLDYMDSYNEFAFDLTDYYKTPKTSEIWAHERIDEYLLERNWSLKIADDNYRKMNNATMYSYAWNNKYDFKSGMWNITVIYFSLGNIMDCSVYEISGFVYCDYTDKGIDFLSNYNQ